MLSQKIQKKIVKEKSTVTEAGDRKVLQRKQVALRHSRKAQRPDHPRPRPKREAKRRQEGSRIGQELRQRRQEVSIDPTSKANGGLLTEVVKGEEEKALDTAIFSRRQQARRPRQDPVRLLRLRGREHHARHAADARRRSKATIKQQLIATGQQTALSEFVKEFKKKWTAKTECRSGYVVRRLQAVQSARRRAASPRRRHSPSRPGYEPHAGALTGSPAGVDREPRMSQIERIHARQILDSRGNPTVEVEIALRSAPAAARRCPRAPRRASSRRRSCATAASARRQGRVAARSPTSTARSPRRSTAWTPPTRRRSTRR